MKESTPQQETKPEEKPAEQQQEVKTVTERHSAFIVGYPDGSFGPEKNMSHAEAVAIFARLLADRRGETITNSGRTGYTDVADNAWYTGYVKYLMDRGVQVSNDNANFKPDEAITRAEFVTLAVRFFDAYGNGNTEIMEQYVEFSDVSSGYWAARYIEDAAAHGWMKRRYARRHGEETERTAERTAEAAEKAARAAREAAERAAEFVKEHWKGIAVIAAIVLLLVFLTSVFSTCSVFVGGVSGVVNEST